MELLLVRPSFLVSFRGQSWLGVLASALDKQRLMERWDVFYPLGRHAEQLFYKVHLSQSWLQAQLILTWRRWRRRRRKKTESGLRCEPSLFSPQTGCCLLYTNVSPTEKRKKSRKKMERERESVFVSACVCQSERECEMVGWQSEICLEYIMKWTFEIPANGATSNESRDLRRAEKRRNVIST